MFEGKKESSLGNFQLNFRILIHYMKKIYLILDTNIWLYLANSYNPSNSGFEDGFHFKLITILQNLIKDKDITILTNSIIISEWKKNKGVANDLIAKYKKSLKSDKNHIKHFKKNLEVKEQRELDEIFAKYSKNIHKVISINEQHISDVEDLLMNKTEIINVSEKVMLEATKRSLDKLAPFKGDKSNSMADAIILLSAIEHIKTISRINSLHDKDFYVFKNSIFVSSNKNDYSNPLNEKEIHPELKILLDSVEMKYMINLGKAINQVKNDLIKYEELEKIEKEMNDAYWKNVQFCDICDSRDSSPGIVDFEEPIQIVNELSKGRKTVKTQNNAKKKKDVDTVQLGVCDYCNSDYLKCQYCGTSNHFDEYIDDNRLECEGCGLAYKIEFNYTRHAELEFNLKIVK